MLYKYTGNSSQAISNINNHALWFNTVTSFNDPFDIYPVYKMDEKERQQAMVLFQKTKDIDIGIAQPLPLRSYLFLKDCRIDVCL